MSYETVMAELERVVAERDALRAGNERLQKALKAKHDQWYGEAAWQRDEARAERDALRAVVDAVRAVRQAKSEALIRYGLHRAFDAALGATTTQPADPHRDCAPEDCRTKREQLRGGTDA
jgi:hypothetical protein